MHKKLVHLLDKPRYFWYLLKYLAAMLAAPFVRKQEKYRDLWLISERGVDAKDNGYWLYRYLKREHPELNVRYILSKDSPDRKLFGPGDDLIAYRSFEHYVALAAAQYKISTHIMGFAPDMWFFTRLDHFRLQRGRIVFLQHGITKDNLPWLHADNVRLDLFVCGAKREAEAIDAEYGFAPGVVRYLGFCRYDGLPVDANRQMSGKILFMPTWRLFLKDCPVQGFEQSGYYKWIMEVINSESLSSLLRKRDCELLFYPHMEMHPYLKCFSSPYSNIRIMEPAQMGIQELLVLADVLITDYSSVFFDFAYMDKPLIYYQPDRAVIRTEHYAEGYFSYERDGFGPVAECLETLEKELDGIFLAGRSMEEKYRGRTKDFFVYRDRQNCLRNYEAIMDLERKDRQDGKN